MKFARIEEPFVRQNMLSSLSASKFSTLASWVIPFGVCGYLISATISYDMGWDIPLAALALIALFALLTRGSPLTTSSSPLLILLFAFLASSALSMFWSVDVYRSLRFGAFMLPAVMVYLLVAHQFRFPRDFHVLFVTFTCISMGLALFLLWTPWQYQEFNYISSSMARATGSPLLIVANDIILLSVLAPFSAVLLFHYRSHWVGLLAGLSLILSVCVTVLYQSRGAVVTLAFAVAVSFLLLLRKTFSLRTVRTGGGMGLGIFTIALLIDGVRDFRLASKFIHVFDNNRFTFWTNAWNKFLEAPFLGHGPHALGYEEGTAHTWVPWAHNLFFELLAERGVIGLVTFLVLLMYGLILAWRTQQSDNHEIQLYGGGALAALAAFSLACLFELSFIRQWVVLMLFTFLGLISHLTFLAPSLKKERTL